MRFTHECNGKPVFFLCGEGQKEPAAFFAAALEREDAAHQVIRDGSAIQVGWGFYKVRQTGGAYQVLACDISEDPFQSVTEDLSLSLEIFSQQRRILRITRAAPVETSLQDTLIIHRPAVKAPRVYLQRGEPGDQGDSGWYMGAVGARASQDPEAYARIYTYQLLSFCKEALFVMHLPMGALCVMEHGRLVEIVDQNNNKLYG